MCGLKLLHIIMGPVTCLKIVWNLVEIFGKFGRNVWDIGVKLPEIKVHGIIG